MNFRVLPMHEIQDFKATTQHTEADQDVEKKKKSFPRSEPLSVRNLIIIIFSKSICVCGTLGVRVLGFIYYYYYY